MKRLNVRPPVVLALSLAAGIAAGLALTAARIQFLWILAVVPPTALFFILCVLRRSRAALPAMTLLALLFFLLGGIGCRICAIQYAEPDLPEGWYEVTGVVTEKGATDYGEYLIVGDLTADGRAVRGKMRVYLGESYGRFCDVGYTVAFSANVRTYALFNEGALNYNAVVGVNYAATVNGGLQADYGFSLFGGARSRIRAVLYDCLSSDTAAVVCAMLLGDADGVEAGILQAFRWGGVAHLFAVSGLHIGILYGVMRFLTKKTGIPKIPAALLCLAAVFAYAGLCGFTLSSLRAAVMCAVAALAGLTYQKYDGLNALALAVIVLLLLSPFHLFSTGFQLSVCAVAGICLLSKSIARAIGKCKLPRAVCNGVSVTLGAQLGVMPVMLANFGYISGAGLLLNIVAIPLTSLYFPVVFAGVFLSAIFPSVAGVLLPAAVLPIEAFLSFLVSAGLENAVITMTGDGLFAALCYLALLFLSDKWNLRPPERMIGFFCAAAAAAGYALIIL